MDKEFLLEKPKGRCTERYIKKNYPIEYNEIMRQIGDVFAEKLYNYFYNEPTHICPTCGKKTPFRTLTKGYSTFCSTRCSYNSDLRMQKIKATIKEKYGVENVSQNEDIKRKKKETIMNTFGGFGWASDVISSKSNQTIKEKYGVENVSQNEDIKRKKELSCIEHFGVKCSLNNEVIRNKAKQAMIKKYGVDCMFRLKNIQDHVHDKQKNRMFDVHDDFLGRTIDGDWIIKCPHPECDFCQEKTFIINQIMYHDRMRNHNELCTKLLIPGKHNQGTSIELFIRHILDEYNIEYQTNVRDVISPKELDIHIPSKNIAIECNGVYWHSKYDGDYHYNKFKECQDKNIQLISVWEDWIINKPEIVKSFLLSKLGIYDKRIYARDCDVIDVSSSGATKFLNENHIQGSSANTVKKGLMYNGRLVAVMCFSHKKGCSGNNKIKDDDVWELTRFCSLKGWQIVGGAERLMKHFINEYHPHEIYSFSCNDISNGNVYDKLGFVKDVVNTAYWYIDPTTMRRYHRTSFCKDRIVELGWRENKDGWTEFEVTKEHGLFRIFDSGMTKWIYYIS